MNSLAKLTVSELVQAFRCRKITCSEYAKHVIACSKDFKDYNNWVYQDHSQLLEQSRLADQKYEANSARPFEGVPIAIKDNVDTACAPTTGCTPALKGRIPKRNSLLASKLFDGGFLLAGKTNMHELAFGITSSNPFTGNARSAFNKDLSAGGSSGGSGGVVGNFNVPLAIGTDTGGSIRIPASNNGVVGFKPTIHRWPSGYGIKITHLRDTIGPLARSVEDIALVDKFITSEESHPRGAKDVRIGIPRAHFWENLDPTTERIASEFLQRLKAAGFNLVEVAGLDELAAIALGCFDMIGYEFIPRLKEYLEENAYTDITVEKVISSLASPDVAAHASNIIKHPTSEESFNNIIRVQRPKVVGSLNRIFSNHDIDCILYPTTPIPPPRHDAGTKINFKGEQVDLFLKTIQNTDFSSFTNSPAITIPSVKLGEGPVPVGMEFMSLTGRDNLLIGLCRTVERLLHV